MGINDEDDSRLLEIDGAESGYAQYVIADGGSVDLFWKGAVPEAVNEVIAQHPTVEVRVHEAKWTRTELLQASDRAMELLLSPDFRDVQVQAVGVRSGADGLTVDIGDVSAERAAAVSKAVEELTSVPAFVATGKQVIPAVN